MNTSTLIKNLKANDAWTVLEEIFRASRGEYNLVWSTEKASVRHALSYLATWGLVEQRATRTQGHISPSELASELFELQFPANVDSEPRFAHLGTLVACED